MMRRWALALGLLAGAAAACPPPAPDLLFHSCWGRARAELILLPDETLPDRASAGQLLVTGVYTGTEPRGTGTPKPVGLFVDGGRVINPNLARMDGILILTARGQPRLQHRARAGLGAERADLADPASRHRFAHAAAAAGASVAQSHLLIVDGRPDVSPRSDAPEARRRVLFTDAAGWGVWQSGSAQTLFAATRALATAYAPRMALNLDMGGADYCWQHVGQAPARRCGLRRRGETGELSNLLSLTLE